MRDIIVSIDPGALDGDYTVRVTAERRPDGTVHVLSSEIVMPEHAECHACGKPYCRGGEAGEFKTPRDAVASALGVLADPEANWLEIYAWSQLHPNSEDMLKKAVILLSTDEARLK